MNSQLHHILTQLAVSAPFEPRGCFRWLHNHYLWRYGFMHPGFVVEGLDTGLWSQLADTPEPLHTGVDNEDLLLDVVNSHAWSFGIMKLNDTTLALWDRLEPLSRAAFLAAISELGNADVYFNMLITFSGNLEYSPESFCQLACNAIHAGRRDILEHLLAQPVDLTASIRRFPAHASHDGWEQRVIDQLSHRVIDMILEASLIKNDTSMAGLALQHGADPGIPVWQLERSYNQKFSALGYVLDSEYMLNMQPHGDMAGMLLEYGAPPAGIPFSGHNHELSLALKMGWHDLAGRLICGGAGLAKPSDGHESVPEKTAGSETTVIYPGGPNFYGYFGNELKWAHEHIGSIIPLVPVSGKQSFYSGNAQGGSMSTLMDNVIGKVELLKQYEAMGLDTRLSAEELCSAVSRGAFDSLVYLLSKHGETARDRAMFRIRRHRPDIGTAWRQMDMVPQTDGVNIAVDYDPGDQAPFELPDGSRLYVDLSAIASPWHSLGPCFEGYFWLRNDTAILRRRKDRVIVRRMEQKWRMEPLPLRKPGICRDQRYLDDCLPLIREMDGKYIHLGVTMGRLWWIMQEGPLKDAVHTWKDLLEYDVIQDQAEQRIKAQVSWNARPSAPALTCDELWG